MRAATQALKDHLAANNAFLVADLVTLTVGGVAYRWTTSDTDIVLGGQTYAAGGPVVEIGKARGTAGVSIDSIDLDFFATSGVTIGTKPIVLAAAEGALDRAATVVVARVYMPTWGDTSLGSSVLFQGNVARVEPTSTGVRITAKTELERLNRRLPVFTYQPACPLALYSSDCGVNKAAHTVTTAATSGATRTVVPVAATLSGVDASWWAIFTSGANVGEARQVRAATSGSVTVEVALRYAPAAGDGVQIIRGCDKRRETCLGTFNNLARFRGFADMPPEA